MKVTRRPNSQRLDTFAATEGDTRVCVTTHRNHVIVNATVGGVNAHFDCTLEQLAALLVRPLTEERASL